MARKVGWSGRRVLAAAVVLGLLAVIGIGLLSGRTTPAERRGASTTALPGETESGDAVEPGTATTSSDLPVVEGAVLAPPSAAATTTLAAADGCAALARVPGAGIEVGCGSAGDGPGAMVWVAERDALGVRRVAVHRRRTGGQHDLALLVEDAGGDRPPYTSVEVTMADATGDDHDDLVVAFRVAGTGEILAVDVVEAPGVVTLHLDLDKGVVSAGDGILDTWSALFGPDDSNCCPSAYLHQRLTRAEGGWTVLSEEEVEPADVPRAGAR